MNLNQPVTYINGISVARADLLYSELGIRTCNDLLHLFPFRYIDKTQFFTIRELQQNTAEVQIAGKITSLQEVKQKRGSRLVAKFVDATGSMDLVWFKGAKWIKDSIKLNTPYVIYGKLNWYSGTANMPHPELELVSEYKKKLQTAMQPVYPATEKLTNKGISQKLIRNMIQNLFKQAYGSIEEDFSAEFMQQNQLIGKKEALLNVHFPKNHELLTLAEYRLKFEELFFIQLQLLIKKLINKSKIKGFIFEHVGEQFSNFYNNHLPFELTGAQKRVLKEIRKDVASGAHMNRLLQGDVGSGKTIVGLLSMLLAIDNGYQATIMAPTEILATQHYTGITELLEGTNIKVALLTGSVGIKRRREIHKALEEGSLHILVGTHAVLEDKVQFHNLGLAIIDEQHRFGVAQRRKLWDKTRFNSSKRKAVAEVLEKYITEYPEVFTFLKEFKKFRKKNKTNGEIVLWEALKTKKTGYEFRQKHSIGDFIIDFICFEKNLIVEVDRGYEDGSPEKELDTIRTEILRELGYQVIRYTVDEIVEEIAVVISKLLHQIKLIPFEDNIVPAHILVMTATPIPRTLAMSVYGDLDISVIDELPPGRKEIKTVHRYDSNRLSVLKFIRDEIEKGRQIYIVYPLIQESEAMDYKDLMDGYESISREFPLPKYQISIVHGQMKPADKDHEMNRFVNGETQIMVATTVIEVGVNVPNASVMIIESAERFGLSQLHQLRGRVGRGAEQSYCILLSSYELSSDGKTRLKTMVDTSDGFKIAEVDLKLRGPGNIMGTQQSGVLNLKIADVVKDSPILYEARQVAIRLLEEDPGLAKPQNGMLKKRFLQLQKSSGIWSNIS